MHVVKSSIEKQIPTKSINLICFIHYYAIVMNCSSSYKKGLVLVANLLEKFAQEKGISLLSDSLDFETANDFRRFLHGRNLRDNTIRNYLYRLKPILEEIDKKGYVINYAISSLKVTIAESEAVALNDEQIYQILKYNRYTELERLARDILVILCKIGVRYSDYQRITSVYIKDDLLHILEQKTKVLAILPVHYLVAKLLKKYKHNFPKFPQCSHSLNKYLKKVCRKAGLIDKVVIQYSKENIVYAEEFETWELVSTHTGRRSFATYLDSCGMPPHEARVFTGHKRIESYLKYIQDQRLSVAKKYKDSPIFNPNPQAPQVLPKIYNPCITDNELLDRLKRAYAETNKTPICSRFRLTYLYINRFGSWNNALIAAGIPLNNSRTNKEELIEGLKTFYITHNRLPIFSDTINKGSKLKNIQTYYRHLNCNSWEDVLKIAGLISKDYSIPEITRDNLLESLRDYYSTYGKSPQANKKDEPPKKYTYRQYLKYLDCKSWEEVLALAGLPPISIKKNGKKTNVISKDTLIDSLREFTIKHNRPPLHIEADKKINNGLFPYHIYLRILQCTEWDGVLKKAGVIK